MIHAEPFNINCKEGEVIVLKALGDIHHLLADSDEEQLIQDLKTRTAEQTFFIDIGDSLDSIGPAHRYFDIERIKPKFIVKKNKDGQLANNPYPLLDAELDDLANIFSKYTRPEEWIGHLSGNHPLMLLGTGLDLAQTLCARLKHRYLGYQCFAPLSFNVGGRARLSLMLFACHGFGGAGARWEGSALNAYIQHSSRYEGWDIAIYGHRHDKWVKALSRIRPVTHSTGGRWIKQDLKLICQAGTYLRTLSRSLRPSYPEKRGLAPRPLGCISIQFRIRRVSEPGGSRNLTIEYLNI